MPRRRDAGLITLLFALPWQAAAVLGAIVWLAAPFIVGKLVHTSPSLAHSQSGFLQLIHAFAGLCFLAAVVSFVRRLRLKQKFALQRSLDDLRALSWREFESVVGEAFRRQGYAVTETGQGGPDGGVDLVLTRAGKRYLVQCKQYRASTVSVMVVREIFGVVAARKAEGAIVVTTGTYTNDAVDFAKGQPIELIDGRRLEAMVRNINDVGASASSGGTRRTPTIDGSSSPTAAAVVRSCPKCGATMVRRTPRAGGADFFGCSTFPKCRGTRPAVDLRNRSPGAPKCDAEHMDDQDKGRRTSQ